MTALLDLASRVEAAGVCETCDGEGTVIEFRRFAGEYQAGEPVELPCPDCDGTIAEPECAYCEGPLVDGWCDACEESLVEVEQLPERKGRSRIAA